jgi:glycosyltransferase involved in cell wall biosynthesis
MEDRSETVVFFGDFDYSYPRERLFDRGLRAQGVEVRECRYKPERTLIGWKRLVYLVPAYFTLLLQFRQVVREESDIQYVLAMRNNHLQLPLVKALTLWYGIPLIFDAFDSNYHGALLKGQSNLRSRWLWFLEFVGLRIPDLLIATTPEFACLYVETYHVSMDCFVIIPPGADEERFHPFKKRAVETDESDADPDEEPFRVVYWGHFHRHHGVGTILDAAARLDEDIRVELIGDGLARSALQTRAEEDGIDNVEFPGRASDEELQRRIDAADVCLGIFSDHLLAKCSITNKMCEALAMRKLVVTRHLPPGIDLRSGEHLLTVPPESPEELATTIMEIRDDEELHEGIAAGGYEYFQEHLGERAIGRRLAALPET